MQIAPPFGYDEIVPLARRPRVLIPHAAAPDFSRLHARAVTARPG